MNYYSIEVFGLIGRYTFRGWRGSVPVVSRPDGHFYGCFSRFELRRLSSGRLAIVRASGAASRPYIYNTFAAASRTAERVRAFFGDAVRVDVVEHER